MLFTEQCSGTPCSMRDCMGHYQLPDSVSTPASRHTWQSSSNIAGNLFRPPMLQVLRKATGQMEQFCAVLNTTWTC
jgi:hypothetical protein